LGSECRFLQIHHLSTQMSVSLERLFTFLMVARMIRARIALDNASLHYVVLTWSHDTESL